MNNLKPCPFCASEKNLEVRDWTVFKGFPSEHQEFAVVCGNCGALGPNDLGWSGAEEQWNIRREEAEAK